MENIRLYNKLTRLITISNQIYFLLALSFIWLMDWQLNVNCQRWGMPLDSYVMFYDYEYHPNQFVIFFLNQALMSIIFNTQWINLTTIVPTKKKNIRRVNRKLKWCGRSCMSWSESIITFFSYSFKSLQTPIVIVTESGHALNSHSQLRHPYRDGRTPQKK